MVQMKVSMRYADKVPADDLYIPHGSDESYILNINIYRFIILYIPHGSDERPNDIQ